MGYCIELRNSDFKMKGKEKQKAFKALQKWADGRSHISWSSPQDIKKTKNLKELLSELRWDIDEKESAKVDTEGLLLKAKMLANSLNDSKRKSSLVTEDQISLSREVADGIESLTGQEDVFDISFNGEKLGDEEEVFSTIAPFVEDGSFIEMSGEDGSIWRWVFKNGEMTEKSANISFD